MTATPELFCHFPSLRAKLPWTPLARPTPVLAAAASAAVPRQPQLWIKRDDRTSDVFGGHRARELEFVLGAARHRGAPGVLAFDRAGSERCLALTAFARQLDLEVVLVLWGRAGSQQARHAVQSAQALGAELVRLDGGPLGLYRVGRRWLVPPARDGRPFVVWPHRARLLAVLGNTNGVYELQRQIRCGILPEPESIYVRSESRELVAGLLLGCELAGLPTRVVTAASPREGRAALGLARRSLGFLRRHLPSLPVRDVPSARLRCIPAATPGAGAVPRHELLRQPGGREPVALEATLPAILATTTGPILYWHAQPAALQPAAAPLLPQALREFVVPS